MKPLLHHHIVLFAAALAAPAAAQVTYGTPCVDSRGESPAISFPASSWIRTTSIGEGVSLVNATPGANAVLFVGADPRDRVGIDLTLIGATGCSLYANPFAQAPLTVAMDGTANIQFPPAGTGRNFVFQWLVVDPAVSRPLQIAASAGLAAGVPTQERVFRISDLDLRDPHVSVGVPFVGCLDLTDTPAPLGLAPALNASVEATLNGDEDMDMVLDGSFLVVLRPDPAGGGVIDFVEATCSAPASTTSCSVPGETLVRVGYDVGAATCAAPFAGTTRPYSPAITVPSGPNCISTAPVTLNFDFAGIQIPLEDVQFAADPTGMPTDRLTNGLLMGFVPESVADAILLPATLPLVGGLPLSTVLPGGTGSCAAGDDRDIGADGVTRGWWFYFNFEAEAVPLM